jgi:hypothetical protein
VAHLLAAGNTRHATWQILSADWPDLTPDALNNAIKDIRASHPYWLVTGDFDKGVETKPPIIANVDADVWEIDAPVTVIGDLHVPLTDWSLLAEVCNTSRQFGIERLIIAGDLYNMDAFSSHSAVSPFTPFEMECEAAEYAIDLALQTFKQIWVFMGNHDEWFLRKIEGKLAAGRVAETFLGWLRGDRGGAVRWSTLAYCRVRSPAGPWLICHPNQYRAVRGSTVAEIALLEHCHVVGHHEHHLAKTVDKSGRYVAVANGMLADSRKMGYVARYKGTRPRMVQGYTIIDEGGVAHVYGGPVGFSAPGERGE